MKISLMKMRVYPSMTTKKFHQMNRMAKKSIEDIINSKRMEIFTSMTTHNDQQLDQNVSGIC